MNSSTSCLWRKHVCLQGLLAIYILGATPAFSQITVLVNASTPYNSTGVYAVAGQAITARASGTANLDILTGPYDTDPSGTIVVAPPTDSPAYNFFLNSASPVGIPPTLGTKKSIIEPYVGTLENAPYGALVGGFSSIPNPTSANDFPNGFKLIGRSGSIRADSPGYLFLSINDFNNQGDNGGSYSVTLFTLSHACGSVDVSAFVVATNSPYVRVGSSPYFFYSLFSVMNHSSKTIDTPVFLVTKGLPTHVGFPGDKGIIGQPTTTCFSEAGDYLVLMGGPLGPGKTLSVPLLLWSQNGTPVFEYTATVLSGMPSQ